MQIGVVTVDGMQVGTVSLNRDDDADAFVPDLEGYEPEGRAIDKTLGAPSSDHARTGHRLHHGGGAPAPGGRQSPHTKPDGYTPRGETFQPSHGSPFKQGSTETDQAIVDASRAHNLDPNTMRSIASIESSMNPSSNANRSTQYKGLYQIGRNEWSRFGNGGNIYSARENAMGAGRMFEANRNQFHQRFGRDPTDTELYMMHQQGLGFYTRGAMTNIRGNPYPGMRGPQTHESFEAGWGREVARRKAGFAETNKPAKPVFDPGTDAL